MMNFMMSPFCDVAGNNQSA